MIMINMVVVTVQVIVDGGTINALTLILTISHLKNTSTPNGIMYSQ